MGTTGGLGLKAVAWWSGGGVGGTVDLLIHLSAALRGRHAL